MRLLSLFDRAVGLLTRAGIALSALTLLVALAAIGYGVAMRYLFNRPIPWVDELVGYLLVAMVMLAAADALRKGEHIAVDIVTERLGRRGRRVTAAAGLLAVAVCGAFLIEEGWGMVAFSRMIGIVSTGSLAVPIWLPQLLIPIGGALLLLAALAGLVRMAQGRPPTDEVHPPADEAGLDRLR